MKKIYNMLFLLVVLFLSSCDLNREPETTFTDDKFWKTETDLQYACNRLYNLLGGFEVDTRADDLYSGPNSTSNGSWNIPNTNGSWADPYYRIFTANNIIEKSVNANVKESIKNRYLAEACFFRAYHYFQLVVKYGDVPLLLHAINDLKDPLLLSPRTPRETVLQQVYDDLDFAAAWAPTRANLAKDQYGRITKSAALALKARVGLYEGTRCKFHNYGDPEKHLKIAVDAATQVMGEGHVLFANYFDMFQYAGEGAANKENIFVKVYGVKTTENALVTHNNSRNLENNYAPTRNLLTQYLCADGLPWGTSPLTVKPETSYNDIFANRDPRMGMTFYKIGETAYKGAFVPYGFGKTGYSIKKGYIQTDWDSNGKAVVDKALIRYAEVLLIYAEAKFELNGSISDDDLDKTINALRKRVGFNVRLTNQFVADNNLNMRNEIRRERTVELAAEGFRYDDIIRWKIAEDVLPVDIMGAKFIDSEWTGTTRASLGSMLSSDDLLIVERKDVRKFNPARDYLYPVPLNEISLSGGSVTQNPNW